MKFAADAVTEFLLLSFKEKDNENLHVLMCIRKVNVVDLEANPYPVSALVAVVLVQRARCALK